MSYNSSYYDAPGQGHGEGSGYAPLTSSLLARKGEALPAVDVQAHDGIDMDYTDGHFPPPTAPITPSKVHYLNLPVQSERVAADPATDSTVDPGAKAPIHALRSRGVIGAGPKATIKFKIAARDFMRVQRAAKAFDISSQAVLLEALECYLDANAIAPLSDTDYTREMVRLKTVLQRRKSPSS